jgi:hypothetical protein
MRRSSRGNSGEHVGQRVKVRFDDGIWYDGTILAYAGGFYSIAYDATSTTKAQQMQHRVEFDGEGGGVADGKWKLTCSPSASTDSSIESSNTTSASPRLPAAVKAESTEAFDEQEYRILREHFFEPVVAYNVELPNGQVLRRQTKPPRMNQPTAGFIKLRKAIAGLEKSGDRAEILRLLCQLRAWETHPPALGGVAFPGTTDTAGANEVIDLSDEGGIVGLDVDQYIIDVLLVRVVKPEPGAPVRVKRCSCRV